MKFTAKKGAEEFMDGYTKGLGKSIEALFAETVKDWKRKPPKIFFEYSPTAYEGIAGGKGKVFHIVNYGRDPKAGWVRYGKIPSGYSPATWKGSIARVQWEEYPPWITVSKENAVPHPGIAERRFDTTIRLIVTKDDGIINSSEKGMKLAGINVNLKSFFGG